MSNIEFLGLNHTNSADVLAVLNEPELRAHLIDHEYFDAISLQEWIGAKIKIDALPGCRVRVIYIDGVLAGWCGIQPDEQGFELAIVLSQRFWGMGIATFKILMGWAKELGHQEIRFHLLDSRPEYKALSKMASKVDKTQLFGRSFTTYYMAVDKWCTE